MHSALLAFSGDASSVNQLQIALGVSVPVPDFHFNIIINDHPEVQHGDLRVSLLKVENVVVEVIDMVIKLA